jgi:outer membrane protein OmpA-like peptidoglycan-associated protein
MDDSASPARSLGLSLERANAVRAALVDRGIAEDLLEAKGYGQTRHLVPNITAANRARNRRVALVITAHR